MKCPVCASLIAFQQDSARCEQGHVFKMKNGVYQIVHPDFARILNPFLEAFEDFRKEEISKVSPTSFPQLPYFKDDSGLWPLRQIDLRLIRKNTSKSLSSILEIGAWNGWLTHHLAKGGHSVTAVDFFIDEVDGLGAKKHYPEEWRAIQMDLEQLDAFSEKFDLIIVNRCLNYFTHPEEIIANLSPMLNPGGKLIITGLTLTRNPKPIIKRLADYAHEFEEKYRTPFKFKNYNGYLTKGIIKELRHQGMNVKMHPEFALKSLVGFVMHKRPAYYYGVFTK